MPSKTLLSCSTVSSKSDTFCEREFLRSRGVCFAASACAAEAIAGFDDDLEIKQRRRSFLGGVGLSTTQMTRECGEASSIRSTHRNEKSSVSLPRPYPCQIIVLTQGEWTYSRRNYVHDQLALARSLRSRIVAASGVDNLLLIHYNRCFELEEHSGCHLYNLTAGLRWSPLVRWRS